MTLQRFGMICLMMFVWPLLSTHSERSSKPISLQKHIKTNFCLSQSLSMALTPAMSQVNDYSFFCFFCLLCLESVFRWRLSAIKILLELELERQVVANLIDCYITVNTVNTLQQKLERQVVPILLTVMSLLTLSTHCNRN